MEDYMKGNYIQIIEIPEREEKRQWIENLFEKILTENFPNLEKGKPQKFRKHRRSQQDEPKEAHSKTHHN